MATYTETSTQSAGDLTQTRNLERDGPEFDEVTTAQINDAGRSDRLDLAAVDHAEAPGSVAEEALNYPTGLRFWLIILTLAALLMLGGLDTNIVATAVPRYVHKSSLYH
jgi:hypothetical protein